MSADLPTERLRVVVAGATTLGGRALAGRLAASHQLIALAERPEAQPEVEGVEWRRCDLFNLLDVERALAGAEVAVYLARAMTPPAQLTQGSAEDLDLLCADNFARAAASCGVRRVVCLGARSPASGEAPSREARSRAEVELTLGARGVPLTVLPAEPVLAAGEASRAWGARFARWLSRLFRSREAPRRVCSVQRLPLRAGWTAADVAERYMQWLPQSSFALLRATVDASRTCRFLLRPLRAPLLVLSFSPERSSPERQLFYVTGGLLAGRAAGPRPRLEFRTVLGGAHALAAIHDFVPRLPWLLYKYTQALVHLAVMHAFARHLAREALQ